MPVWLILLTTALYMGALFAMAWKSDKRASQPGFRQGPLIYALAIGVYCTSWTYFGAVGTAASSGWDYLPIYIGPALVFLLLPGLIKRIGDVSKREGISSLSGFLSARYGKSQGVAAIATLAAVTGSLPYIALQLKSVGMSFTALSAGVGGGDPANETVLLTAISLAAFAILFGTRQSDTTQHNAGLMRVLAFEAVLKLVALVAVCILSIVLLGEAEPQARAEASEAFHLKGLSSRFVTITLLSMAAIICLPRQFHVAMIERRSGTEVATARWAFPAYLLATSLVVIPITMAGLAVLPGTASPDLFVIDLPLAHGDGVLALIVFLGGFSAATGMVIISTIALSTMVTSDLIVPSIMGRGRYDRLGADSGARLVMIRRLVIIAILGLAYFYYRFAGSGEALAQIGLLSFAAAIQFAPALICAVYWAGGRRNGVIAGLVGGMGIWTYTLFLPVVIGAGDMATMLPGWADPHALFGFGFGDSLSHGLVWSMMVNIGLFVAVSLQSRERLRDRVQAAAFVATREPVAPHSSGQGALVGTATPDGLHSLAMRFLNEDAVSHAFKALGKELGIAVNGDAPADWRLVQRTERLLANALGASSARVVMSSALGGQDIALPDVLSMLDQQTQAERFDRHMLQSMLENIPQGVSVVDNNQNLVAWNSAYVSLFDYPSELVRVGQPVAALISHNLGQGWITGDPAAEAERRIDHMRSGKPHRYERENPDGRFLRIIGNPMPGGGYVTTFTDITDDHRRERALIEANETLESRVRERTQKLQDMADDLASAKQDAEGANASKTRFLAAASHDLLQPLNAARLFLGAIKSRDDLTQQQLRDLVAKTDKSIQSADDLLKGLLDISRLDHGDVVPRPADLPLGPLLEDLADEAEPMIRRAGLTLRVAPTSLSVHADPDYLKSILRNFLSNARRYTRTGGVLIGARRAGEHVRIEVWDTGPGIPAERHATIFEEFQRFEDADNLGIRGAGLGLSVASRLAKVMQASLGLESTLGKGSVFHVTVPRAQAPGVAVRLTTEAKPTHDTPLSGLRVMCLDDEASILEGMAALLSGWGCEVSCFHAAGPLREAIARDGCDVLIADLNLGDGEDGLVLLESLRAPLGGLANTALLTAYAGEDLRAHAAKAGVIILNKPVNPDDISAFLEDCRARAALQAAE